MQIFVLVEAVRAFGFFLVLNIWIIRRQIMLGIIYSLAAGVLLGIQNVLNAKVGEKIGLWQTTTIVHILGLIVSIVMLVLMKGGSFQKINEVNKIYLIGGAFGALIVFCVMNATTMLGPAYAVAILLVSQLLMALIIDSFGMFGVEKIPFTLSKLIGIVMMIGGIIIFKFK